MRFITSGQHKAHFGQRIPAIFAILLLTLVACVVSRPLAIHAGGSVPAKVFRAGGVDLNGNVFTLRDPELDNKPTLALAVTQRWSNDSQIYNNNPIAIQYNSAAGLWQIFNRNFQPIPDGALFNVAFTETSAVLERIQIPVASSVFNYFAFNAPDLDNDPNVSVIITPFKVNSAVATPADSSAYGIWYDSAVNKWSGYWETTSQPISANFGFHVFSTMGLTAYVHQAIVENTQSNYTYLDNPAFNGDPDALIFITHNYNPGNTTTGYLEHQTGVWYDTSRGQWAIFNQDMAAMPIGTTFNVMLAAPLVSLGAPPLPVDPSPTPTAVIVLPPPIIVTPTPTAVIVLPPPVIVTPTPVPLIVLPSGATPVVPPVSTGCLPSRLTVGGSGRITPGAPNRLRTAANTSAPIIAMIPASSIVTVVGPSACSDTTLWVQVQYGSTVGFTAEAQGGVYFIDPAS